MTRVYRAVSNGLIAGTLAFATPAVVHAADHDQDASAASADCADAVTTQEIDACLTEQHGKYEAIKARYLEAALSSASERPELATMIRNSEMMHVAYAKAECGAVYEDWVDGTIRTAMAIGCYTALTKQRTHTIWRNWLAQADGSTPELPEPDPF